MLLYRAYFKLTNCVKSLKDANDYLKADDMTKYLKQENRIPESIRNKVEKIEWSLKDESSGTIDLGASETLSKEELQYISDFVASQCDDGLGSGFSEQDFAYYEDEGLTGYEGSDWDNETIVASMIPGSDNFRFFFIA